VTAVESGNVVLAIAGVIEDEKGKGLVDEARVKLGSRFLFLDRVPHSDMPTAYGAADLFALCSTAEILGIAFLESMASGIPCIGHCFPVTEWVIGSGGTCIDMLGKGILAAEIDKYAANGMLRKERGAAARKRVEKMFSKDVVTDQILAMYGEVAKEHTCQCHHSCS
jgi:glycosyltransferase involved in cell wall biosynthesis